MKNRTVRFGAAAVGAAVVIGGLWFYLHRDRPAPTGLAALSVPAGFKVERAAGPDLVLLSDDGARSMIAAVSSSANLPGTRSTTRRWRRIRTTRSACSKTATAMACSIRAKSSPRN